jgi:hypothetical protein
MAVWPLLPSGARMAPLLYCLKWLNFFALTAPDALPRIVT